MAANKMAIRLPVCLVGPVVIAIAIAVAVAVDVFLFVTRLAE